MGDEGGEWDDDAVGDGEGVAKKRTGREDEKPRGGRLFAPRGVRL